MSDQIDKTYYQHWVDQFLQATPEQQLNEAIRILEATKRAARCFEENHVNRLLPEQVYADPLPEVTIGAVVHYVSFGTPGGEYQKACRAAVITEFPRFTDDMKVSLCVLNPSGQFFNTDIDYDTSRDPKGGTWHWPKHGRCAPFIVRNS